MKRSSRDIQINAICSHGDPIWIRCLKPKGMPDDTAVSRGMGFYNADDRPVVVAVDGYLDPIHQGRFKFTQRFSSGKTRTFRDGVGQLKLLNESGYGIYLVVNPGGRVIKDITHATCFFYEIDGTSKDEQGALLKTFEESLGQPATCVVETFKSLHVYFRLKEPMTDLDLWSVYQRRIIQKLNSDVTVSDPAQLMRLAGFYHWRWNGGDLEKTPVKVIQYRHTRFELGDFDRVLPEYVAPQNSQRQSTDTDAASDPWDIRNFARYLPGYRDEGRRGTATCKCPVHGGESLDSLHIKWSSGQFHCHSNCATNEIWHHALEVAIMGGYKVPIGTCDRWHESMWSRHLKWRAGDRSKA